MVLLTSICSLRQCGLEAETEKHSRVADGLFFTASTLTDFAHGRPSRLGAAANFRREVNDIKVKASASQRGGVNLAVEGKIDLSKVKVTTLGGLRVGRFNVAVFCLDSAGNPMGTHMQELPLQSSEEEYARFLKSGFPYLIEFPAIRGTRNIRLVVYDFGSDLLGRVDTNVF